MSIICPYCATENHENALDCMSCGAPFSVQTSGYYLSAGSSLQQGKYKIETLIGEGGFGITYRGIDLVNSRTVAIKENWPEKASRQGTTVVWPHTVTPKDKDWQLKKVATEAQYLSQCQHPNIVRVYDYFQENSTAYVVMDFITGKPLSKILEEEGPLPMQRVKRYLLQLSAALTIVHGAKLLHRDIKPENILIDGQDRAILIDFGATKEFIAGQTRQMSVTLTRGYAPLEQYSYKAKRYPATDIYALCASMYELLTGQLPAEATDRISSETLVPPRQLRPDLSPLIEHIILTGMKIKVEERFQTADELIKVLRGSSVTPKLIPLKSVSFITEILLDKSRLIIGRSEPGGELPDIDLDSFPDANTVSRPHAGIYQEAGEWKVKDLGSVNGTFIKRAGQSRFGNRMTAIEILNSGDEIAFGKIRFRFENI
ncbi:serine/threonine protein kinase [filamentous cyanobacterium Phorm 6]|nr:serine/threonine protein kinase [filamentous cyanobacterium Phorm 6]